MYPHAQGYENFVKQLLAYFPDERKALEQYIYTIRTICDKFPLYRYNATEVHYDVATLSIKLSDFLDNLTTNERFKAVLLGASFLYAGVTPQTPLYVHALSVNSYI